MSPVHGYALRSSTRRRPSVPSTRRPSKAVHQCDAKKSNLRRSKAKALADLPSALLVLLTLVWSAFVGWISMILQDVVPEAIEIGNQTPLTAWGWKVFILFTLLATMGIVALIAAAIGTPLHGYPDQAAFGVMSEVTAGRALPFLRYGTSTKVAAEAQDVRGPISAQVTGRFR